MDLDFLYASDGTPITKTFERQPNGWNVTQYPMVARFNSIRTTVTNIEEAYEALVAHSTQGAGLLKGLLTRPLRGESRAGTTEPHTPTTWLCLDLDFNDGFEGIDAFLTALDPALSDVSYIWQPSASQGITQPLGLRGHVFIALTNPATPSAVKTWLKARNLTLPQLLERTTLSANGLSLKYPLDISTCQNDKLLFIAAPQIIGGDDPVSKRFTLVPKARDAALLTFNTPAARIEELVYERVTELRQASGLRKRQASTKIWKNATILANPDPATVTGLKEERGFVYLNLNDGDSWGYYFPKDNPSILYNFKDEPLVRLQDIAPDVYTQYRGQIANPTPTDDEVDYFAIRDRLTDIYYTVRHNRTQETVEMWAVSSLDKIASFLALRGQPIPEHIEDWEVLFDPRDMTQIDRSAKRVNLFRPSAWMKQEYPVARPIPPITQRILDSLLSEPEAQTQFLNWLAFIWQRREKTQTAWIFSGTTGTGKGLLFHHILRPLFGTQHVVPILTANLEEKFNAFTKLALINWVDEFRISDGNHKTIDRIKNLITDEYLSIREMRANPVDRQVFNNLICATNAEDPIPIDTNDRRFNIAPPQLTSLSITFQEIQQLENELADFAAFLSHWNVCEADVRKPLLNTAKQQMMKAAQTTTDAFFAALLEGNLDYFTGFIDGPQKTTGRMPNLLYSPYYDTVKRWAQHIDTRQFVPRDELEAAYHYLQGQMPSSAKFSRMCRIHGIEIAPGTHNGRTVRGTHITFTGDTAVFEQEPNVVPLDNRRNAA